MANPERGEVSITLEGQQFTMRPTYQALIEIEQATGQKIMPLARSVGAGEYGVTDLAAIITAGIKAGGGQAKAATVGAMIMATGVANADLIASVVQFLGLALTGGAEAKAPGEA